jgi:acetate kinase
MGFTPLDGLVMATRSGSLDPGLVLWLQEHVGTPAAELAATLEHRSGLLGLSGSADMREVLVAAGVTTGRDADSSGPGTTIPPDDARLALDVYLHRLRADIGAMAASLDGLDALVFTGGVGERSPEVRRLAVEGLGFLGLAIDDARNADGPAADAAPDRDVSAPGSRALTLVVESREDLEIARSVRALLDPALTGALPQECQRAA